MLDDLKRVLDKGTEPERAAAALALSRSPDPAAAGASARPRRTLRSGRGGGKLSWQASLRGGPLISEEETMRFIDPHIHMSARTTDDYERMAAAGIVALDRAGLLARASRARSVGTYIDYLSALVGWERFRAAQFGIRHYCTIGLNSKEANNEALAEQVLEVLPRYIVKEGVVAVGEIGYDDQTPAEDKCYRAQLNAGQGDAICWCRCTRRTGTRNAGPAAAWTWRSKWAWSPRA